ncbi:hypothetical protein GCM10009733_049670 [Nonomuraea maheshkhaliensis]|uniref:Uncharacterized protein n=1 Tax=Nonomuraea maheshkhaliensis TaxID=419590 RepID=A0ABN2FH33_9ACTN
MPRPPGHDVVGREEVHRTAHEDGAHHAASRQQVRERRRVERAQPRPEPGERLLRLLRLQPAQVRDGVEDRQIGAIEQ